MVIDKMIYTAGEFGGVDYIIELMRNDKCKYEYFIYKTDDPKLFLHIGNFNMLKREQKEVTILGIGATKKDALKIAVHIISKEVAKI